SLPDGDYPFNGSITPDEALMQLILGQIALHPTGQERIEQFARVKAAITSSTEQLANHWVAEYSSKTSALALAAMNISRPQFMPGDILKGSTPPDKGHCGMSASVFSRLIKRR